MRTWKRLIQLLLTLLLSIGASGVVSAKVASGPQNLGSTGHQAQSVFNWLTCQGKTDRSTTVAPGCSVVPKGGASGFYDPRQWRQNYEDFYGGNVTSTTVPPYSKPNVRLAGQRHPVTGVVYDQRGFPIFDDVARYDTRFSSSQFNATDYQGQMRMATRDLRDQMASNPQLRSQFTPAQRQAIQSGESKIPDYTWHHHQDTGRMQLVPSRVHSKTGHVGGESMSQGQ